MIYLTGDTHGDFSRVAAFCRFFQTTKKDLMIVLGDNGVNYHGPHRDKPLKKRLEQLPITFMMVRGNHDQRPSTKVCKDQYHYGGDFGHSWSGHFLVDPEFPSLLYAIDGEYYTLGGHSALVIGGAYSVDKWLRILDKSHYGRWFYDEQLTPTERDQIFLTLKHYVRRDLAPDVILSHTCPFSYIPREMFLKSVDQSTVDDSMERWLDEVNNILPKENLKWYCGHWHTDKIIDHMRFMYQDIITLNPLYA